MPSVGDSETAVANDVATPATGPELDASVVIPTYNRSQSLRRSLESLAATAYPHERWEVVIVDNNCTDDTPLVAEEFGRQGSLNVRYVQERRLSFTAARHTGAAAALGRCLLYIDDDVTVEPEWLASVVRTFAQDPRIGMVSGPIRPVYETVPPDWVLAMDQIWLSCLEFGPHQRDVPAAAGPNLCVRKQILQEVGGFPPDCIGVPDGGPGSQQRIYIGPGDWGVSQRVLARGYRIVYSPDAVVHHHIPAARLTRQWWRARLAGEGCGDAITQQYERQEGPLRLAFRGCLSLLKAAKHAGAAALPIDRVGKRRSEFLLCYHLSRARTHFRLARRPSAAARLWEVGLVGLAPDEHGRTDILRFAAH